jgi:hypothetical protein
MQTIPGDAALLEVMAELRSLDANGSRMAAVLRWTFDQLYDGANTGRFRWDQLRGTEKTHCGSLVEINVQREFKLPDGDRLDFMVAGHEVDCKFSRGGTWMIPNEARGQLCLVIEASDEDGRWSAGLVRATDDALNVGLNRDQKTTMNAIGRARIDWLHRHAYLPPNVLLGLDEPTLTAVIAPKSGQERLNQLLRLVRNRRIGRGVIATVAQQKDYMKRVRENGGARSQLRPEGILVLGDYLSHQAVAAQLGIEVPQAGEVVSTRVVPANASEANAASIGGALWRCARDDEPVVPAPRLPSV